MSHKQLIIGMCLALTLSAPIAMADNNATMDNSVQSQNSSSDTVIKAKILASYATKLNPFKIDVMVNNGKVMLKGNVKNSAEKDLAECIASKVDGVNAVTNSIKVGSKNSTKDTDTMSNVKQQASDTAVTGALKAKLLADSSVSGSAIKVVTNNGIVTLSGKVDSEAEKNSAEKIAKDTSGVDKVINKIYVDAPQS